MEQLIRQALSTPNGSIRTFRVGPAVVQVGRKGTTWAVRVTYTTALGVSSGSVVLDDRMIRALVQRLRSLDVAVGDAEFVGAASLSDSLQKAVAAAAADARKKQSPEGRREIARFKKNADGGWAQLGNRAPAQRGGGGNRFGRRLKYGLPPFPLVSRGPKAGADRRQRFAR